MREYSIQRQIVQGRIENLMDVLQKKLKSSKEKIELSNDEIFKMMKVTDEMLHDDKESSRILIDLQDCYDTDNFETLIKSIRERHQKDRQRYQLERLIELM